MGNVEKNHIGLLQEQEAGKLKEDGERKQTKTKHMNNKKLKNNIYRPENK